jgi:hypothetical protein
MVEKYKVIVSNNTTLHISSHLIVFFQHKYNEKKFSRASSTTQIAKGIFPGGNLAAFIQIFNLFLWFFSEEFEEVFNKRTRRCLTGGWFLSASRRTRHISGLSRRVGIQVRRAGISSGLGYTVALDGLWEGWDAESWVLVFDSYGSFEDFLGKRRGTEEKSLEFLVASKETSKIFQKLQKILLKTVEV